MKPFKHYDSCTRFFTAFLLLIVTSVCHGKENRLVVRPGIVKQWTDKGVQNLEYQKLTKKELSKFEVNKHEKDVTQNVENQCYEITGPGTQKLLMVLSKAHFKARLPTPAYTLDGLGVEGECNSGYLVQKMYVLKNGLEEDKDGLKVEETYEVLFKINEHGDCYKRVYKVAQTFLEITVSREEPVPVGTAECEISLPAAEAGSTETYHTSWSPAGKYLQTDFDDSKTAISVPFENKGIKMSIECKKTLVSKLRLIYVANIYYQDMIIDRFEVWSCKKYLLDSSFLIEPAQAPKVTFKTGDVCYERSYAIVEKQEKNSKFKVYSVNKTELKKLPSCSGMKITEPSRQERATKPENFNRYLEYVV